MEFLVIGIILELLLAGAICLIITEIENLIKDIKDWYNHKKEVRSFKRRDR